MVMPQESLASAHGAQAGRVRLAVRHTFLEVVGGEEERSPQFVPRSKTDSLLLASAGLEEDVFETDMPDVFRSTSTTTTSSSSLLSSPVEWEGPCAGTDGEPEAERPTEAEARGEAAACARIPVEQSALIRLTVKHTFLELVDEAGGMALRSATRWKTDSAILLARAEDVRLSDDDADACFNTTPLASAPHPAAAPGPTPAESKDPEHGKATATAASSEAGPSAAAKVGSATLASSMEGSDAARCTPPGNCKARGCRSDRGPAVGKPTPAAYLPADPAQVQRSAAQHLRRRAAARADILASGPKTDVAQRPWPHTVAGRTTVMLRNLPNNYSRAMVLAMLNHEGFKGLYDFVYVPMDFKRRAGLGYAFVNLVDPNVVPRFWSTFDGFTRWVLPTAKVGAVGWSEPHQGLDAHVERYRNSSVMHESVPDEFKPVVFLDSVRRPFPPPTRALPAPTQRVGSQ